MGDFERLKEALEEGQIVVLEKAKDGSIKFGSSFDNYTDLIDTEYFPSNPHKAVLMPEYILVKQHCSTFVL